MQPDKNSIPLFAFILFIILIGCNETGTGSGANNNDMDSGTAMITNDTSSMPSYDPAMDSYNIGGENIQKISDSLNIRMYVFSLKPGDSAGLHFHPDHTVYVLQGGTLAVYFNGTDRQEMKLESGTGFTSGPISDAGKNIGKTTVRLLVTDIYRPRNN